MALTHLCQSVHARSNSSLTGLSVLFVMLAALLAPSSSAASNPVGQVLMVAGGAQRTGSEGVSHPLQQGDSLFIGDQLTTLPDGRLQIKMRDQALIVLMPESTLTIHDYKSNGSNPTDFSLKLELTHGKMRSISGQAGQANPDAFRLNTPIAAIGIRGTDFTTFATPDLTQVRLHAGSIVLAPFGENCLASALGACYTDNSLTLSESLARAAEIKANDPRPRAIDPGTLPDDGYEDLSSPLELLNTHTPEVLSPAAQPDDNIHWGRWSSIDLEGVPIVTELMDAGHNVVFANSMFALFRDGYTQLGQGSASFRLEAGEAYINQSTRLTAASISRGTLALDFDQRTFNTRLNIQLPPNLPSTVAEGSVEHPISHISLIANGALNTQGHLIGTGGNMDVLGGLSNDNQQAGYLFNHTLNSGDTLQGATQWRRP